MTLRREVVTLLQQSADLKVQAHELLKTADETPSQRRASERRHRKSEADGKPTFYERPLHFRMLHPGSSRWPGRTLRLRRRLRSQRDVPHVLTARTKATPRQLGFIGRHGLGPVARRARDVNRHSMQSSESMRRRAVQNWTGRTDRTVELAGTDTEERPSSEGSARGGRRRATRHEAPLADR
jgi:hypothetical protein